MEPHTTKQKRFQILILALVTFILLIACLSVFFAQRNERVGNVDLINKTDFGNDQIIDHQDFERVQAELRKILTEHYATPASETIVASIRNSSYIEENYQGSSENGASINFLMDVENNRVTYRVFIIHDSVAPYAISLNCVTAAESKYPDSFCIGTSGNSSIDANAAQLFPYRKIKDGQQTYLATHPSRSSQVILGIEAHCDDDTAKQAAKDDFSTVLQEHGINTDFVDFSYDDNVCKAFEDQGGGGHEHLHDGHYH